VRYSSLTEWLTWMEALHPSEIDLGLQRVHAVAENLGILEFSATVITVAGTNGKGSFVCALNALLSGQGHRVGAYTSPHIEKYNERIELCGALIDDHELCQAFSAIDHARGDISLTYFEFGTLAALYLFQRASLDYILLEVGLGGRLDAVNIVDADLAVITSIGIDHEAWLGNNREDIAREKAGILRPGIACVCAEAEPPLSLSQAFSSMQVSVSQIGRDFVFNREAQQTNFMVSGQSYGVQCSLPAPSVAAALECFHRLGFKVEDGVASLQGLELAGRLQSLQYRGKNILVDVAHNPAAGQHLAANISGSGKHYDAIVAIMADKDAEGLFAPLAPLIDRWYCIALNEKRAMTPKALKSLLVEQLHVPAENIVCTDICSALNDGANELLVFGSFFLISELKSELA
jgi:dihydrofolate synthase/folylpolyglutamate synthase